MISTTKASKQLINERRSNQMLEDLSNPGIHHKFVAVLEQRAPSAKLFRKSGTWREWHADSVLVEGQEWRHYILVGLVQSSSGEAILREIVPVAEDALRRGTTVAAGEAAAPITSTPTVEKATHRR